MLRYDPNKGSYIVNLDREALERAPTIAVKDSGFDWSDPAWNRRVHDYYKMPLY